MLLERVISGNAEKKKKKDGVDPEPVVESQTRAVPERERTTARAFILRTHESGSTVQYLNKQE